LSSVAAYTVSNGSRSSAGVVAATAPSTCTWTSIVCRTSSLRVPAS
jgi:hypothetical protein